MTPAQGRPTWGDYALGRAWAASRRSQDPYRQVGAVILRPDRSVASVGYNGPPPGIELDWSDRLAYRELVIHAETNALRYCTRGEVTGGFAAVTHIPCPPCLTALAAHGLVAVNFQEERATPSNNEDSYRVARALGITLAQREVVQR